MAHFAPDSAAPARKITNSPAYQAWLVILLSINFGIVFFDRNSLNFLMPFVQPELGLSNSQVGFVAGIFSFIWAIAAFAVSRVSDMVGNRKLLLVIATVAFSACSFVTGIAASFLMLVGARILMGLAEGGVMPISHAMVASEVEPKMRGLAQGVAQNLGSNFFGSFVAPVVLVWLAQRLLHRRPARTGLRRADLVHPERAGKDRDRAGRRCRPAQANWRSRGRLVQGRG